MKIPKIGKDGNNKFVELDAVEEVRAETSPAEIDAKRASHSLERASQLAERGDFAGAILATRQAIALNHDSVDAHGMLGQFLERSGDLKSAASSYSKALELAPDSALDKVSLERVQERLKESSNTDSFSFNDSELTDYSLETTPFDSDISADSTSDVAIDAKLPPTRAEIEALSAAQATAPLGNGAVGAIVTGIPAEEPPFVEADLPVAAALPPTTAAPGGIEATLPPTSVGVLTDAMTASLNAAPKVHESTTPISAPLPPTSKSVASAARQVLNRRESGDRRRMEVPVPIERRTNPDRRAATLGTVPSPFVFQPVFENPKAPLWAQFLRQPSFFGRTLPLVVLAVFSLGFLSWARERAVARAADTPTTLANNVDLVPTDPVNPVVTTPQTQTGVVAPNPQTNASPNAAANQNDGFSISNSPVQPAANAPAAATAANNASPATRANDAPPVRQSTTPNRRPVAATPPRGRTPQFPVPSLAPAQPSEILAERDRRNRANNNGTISLPQPQINREEPAEAPIRVTSEPSQAAPPLNPAGSANNGYIRIRSGSLGAASAPQRPQNQANANEQTATNAARTGQTEQAIQGLTTAINSNPSDAGFRFQQRASLFLERGDYSRAIDDFQSAISAYQEQINRGENVSAARSGLRSARSGLNVAITSRRNGD